MVMRILVALLLAATLVSCQPPAKQLEASADLGPSLREALKADPSENGLKDYIACADSLTSDPEFGKYLNAVDDLLSSKNPNYKGDVAAWARGRDPIDLEREMTKRWGGKLDMIARANSKPVFDPRDKRMNTTGEIYSGLRRISKFARHVAEIQIIDGQTAAATKTIIDQLEFIQRYRRLSTIADLVGSTAENYSTRLISKYHSELSAEDWDRLISYIRKQLTLDTPLVEALESEKLSQEQHFADLENLVRHEKYDPLLDEEEEDETTLEQIESFNKLPVERKVSLVKQAAVISQASLDQTIKTLRRPESQWKVEDDSDMDPYVAMLIEPVYLTQSLLDSERNERAKLRLIPVYGLIEKYRLQHGRLPKSLADLNSPKDVTDPVTGRPMNYDVSANEFLVSAQGVGYLKTVELIRKPEHNRKPPSDQP